MPWKKNNEKEIETVDEEQRVGNLSEGGRILVPDPLFSSEESSARMESS